MMIKPQPIPNLTILPFIFNVVENCEICADRERPNISEYGVKGDLGFLMDKKTTKP